MRGRKGEYKDVFEEAKRDGFVRIRVDGETKDLDTEIKLDKQKKHNLEIIIDRLIVSDKIHSRLTDSIETALGLASGIVLVDVVGGKELLFSENYACLKCSISYEELAPRMFSFNSPYGACPTCNGLGTKMEIDSDLIIPDKTVPLDKGAIAPWGETKEGWYLTLVTGVVEKAWL